MSELIASRYEIIKTIGHGGMADVYLALDTILNREVAIKILKADMSCDPVSLERFSREANSSTKLSHPNVVEIYDVGEDNDKHYIVMEYVKGYTLKQLIKRRGAIAPREAVWMIKQLALALLEAHKNGLIHRDIKSQNVLIKDDGTVKLADFGIAVLNNSLQLTSKDSVLGSVHYLAPELAKGDSASMQSDIYSLGIVLYELLTGDVPYKADTPVQVALKHIKEPLPDVRKFNSDIPQAVVNILIKATAKNPNVRYENVALMIKDINAYLNGSNKNTKALKSDEYNISKNANDVIKEKHRKVEKGFSVLLIASISLISIIALVIILFMCGVFKDNSLNLVKVPEVVGLNQASANDVIDSYGLKIDYPIIWQLTDDIEQGTVIGISPDEGSSIEKGSKVKLTVSSGIYSVMSDYVGRNIKEVEDELKDKFIIQKKTVSNNDVESGTIVSQNGVLANDKYDPDVKQTVIFEVAYPESVNIPTQILGKNIADAKEYLEDEGFNVETELLKTSELTDEEKRRYKSFEVCRMDPMEGSYFEKSDDTFITLYYFVEEITYNTDEEKSGE